MRVVFLGTPEFAVPSLEALLRNQYEVAGVITQPDRPAGRGQELTASPVKRIAEEAGVPIFQPPRIRSNPEAIGFLKQKSPELILVVAFGQILPEEFFAYPPLGALNVHASLLPYYRGAAPVVHALIQGEKTTGVTIMKIDAGMDTGDILTQGKVPIGENTTAGELEEILANQGAELLVETIPGYARGEIKPQPQDHSRATLAPRIKKEDARIDWNRPARDTHNWIRAFNPWPVAFTTFRSQIVKIWRSELGSKGGPPARPHAPGEVVEVGTDEILVCCGGPSVIALKELQLPNRKRLSARDFVNGTDLRVGEIFR